jgi:hypothetical protein
MVAVGDAPIDEGTSSIGVVVECHSGHTYAERPRAFEWEGERLAIVEIAAEWQTPEAKHFRVILGDQRTFELIYDPSEDEWQISER